MLGDAVAMAGPAGERAKDQHVESSREEVVSHRLSMEAYGGLRVNHFPIGGRWGSLSESRGAGGSVDGFDQGEAAAAFAAVADWFGVVGDGLEEVFEDGFVAADVGYRCGGGTLIGVAGRDGCNVGGRVAEVGGSDAIVFEDYGAFGAGDFKAAWVAGVGSGRG